MPNAPEVPSPRIACRETGVCRRPMRADGWDKGRSDKPRRPIARAR
jgi:hypothetical protein